jgi:23S rRNA pseudouridine1911/1915/1917 synthase
LKITVDHPSTLLTLLQELYPESPRTRIKKILGNGVLCNGRIVTSHNHSLNQGDVIEIKSGAGNTSVKNTQPFNVLYEDQNVIVIDKPAGISTSSTDGSLSVHKILSETLKKQSKGKLKSYVIHRLDKEVSGVLLFAKSQRIMNIIKDRWKETKKLYYALVEGEPEKPEDTIESYLVEDKALKVHSTVFPQNAKYSITHYRTIKRMHNYTLLEINLETGRKNQIRVHLSDIGCPIVGDRKYGASETVVRRVRLHAWFLSFPHPETGEIISIESKMPEGFLHLSNADEKYK